MDYDDEAGLRSVRMIAARALFYQEYQGQFVAFQGSAASLYAKIVVRRRLAGNPIGAFDALIAVIALTENGTIAT